MSVSVSLLGDVCSSAKQFARFVSGEATGSHDERSPRIEEPAALMRDVMPCADVFDDLSKGGVLSLNI